MKKYFFLAHTNYSGYYYTHLLLEVVVGVCIFLIVRKSKKSIERTVLLSYLICLEFLFLFTDLVFPLAAFRHQLLRVAYFESVELLNELFGILEVYVGFTIYNLRLNSSLIKKARSISLAFIVLVSGIYYYQILNSETYSDIYRNAEMISSFVYASLTIGGVIHFVECYRKNIFQTNYSWLCFIFFFYSTISYLIFPLSMYCYEHLANTNYWRVLNAYHVILILAVAISITKHLAFKRETETRYIKFVT